MPAEAIPAIDRSVDGREDPQAAVVRAWADNAVHWERHAGTLREMFAPLSRALIDHAALRPGMAVLDVATGAGDPALRIAELHGPSVAVTCTDPVAPLIAAARRDARRRELRNVHCVRALAGALPFATGTFDAVVCQLGAMFFADTAATLREMLRVTRSGGRVVLAVWHRSEANPFFHLPQQVVARYVPLPPRAPDAPGAFRYAAPGALASVLAGAGGSAVTEDVLDFRLEAAVRLDEVWPLRVEISEALRGAVAKLPAVRIAEVRREVEDAVRPFFATGRMSFPARAILVTARR